MSRRRSITTGSRSERYANVLPSLLLKYNVSDALKLKAAWTNTLSRPRYFDLVPYRQVNYEDMEISVGNSDLEAATSMNLDVMGEWYLSGLGLVSAGAFYKDIKDRKSTRLNSSHVRISYAV